MDKGIVTAEKDFGHDVAFVTEMFDLFFGAQVIETIGVEFDLFVFFFGEGKYCIVTFGGKFKSDVSTWFYFVTVVMGTEIIE